MEREPPICPTPIEAIVFTVSFLISLALSFNSRIFSALNKAFHLKIYYLFLYNLKFYLISGNF